MNNKKIRITICYYLVFIVLGLVRALFGPTLVELSENVGVDLDQISSVFTFIALGNLIGATGGGTVFDRLTGHPVLVLALIFMSITVGFTPAITGFWLLMAVVLLLGIAEGVIDSGINTLLIWLHGNMIGPFMNGLHFSYGFGAFFSPIIIAQVLIITGDFSPAYWISASLVIPLILAISRLPSPKREISEQNEKIISTGTGIDFSKVLPIVFFFFFYAGSEVSFSSWIYTYAVQMRLSDSTSAAYLTSAFWGAFTVGRLAAIPLSTRLNPLIMIIGNLVGALCALSMIVFWPDSVIILWCATALLGFFMASVFPSMINFAGRRMQITGTITGLFFTGSGIGAMLLPWLIGQIFDKIGPNITMKMIEINIFMAFFIILLMFRFERKKVEEIPS